jgi:hypothetical protein
MSSHEEDLRLIPTTQTFIMDQINSRPDHTYILGGDFNCDICSIGIQNDQPLQIEDCQWRTFTIKIDKNNK